MDAGISVADEADLAAIDEWLRKERDETGDGFYCNWGIIVSSFEERELYVLRTDGYPVAFLSDQGTTHNIAEVHPEHRGKGYGKRLATHMIALSREHGLSVIEIDCAPSTSVPFWRRMGFTPHLSRLGYGGGIYAHKELPWDFEQGTNRRMPVEINFYPANKGYDPNAAPFRTYSEDAEVLQDGSLQLPRRAVCFDPDITQLYDCFVEISLQGKQIYRDKVKRSEARDLGVMCDAGGIYHIERIKSVPGKHWP